MRKTFDIFYLSDVLRDHLTFSRAVKTASFAAVALSLGLLSACGDIKTAGGGPSGSEAGNAITAQIMTAKSEPAAFARVKLMDSESLDGEGAYEAETDKDGIVTIPDVAAGDYVLEAKLDGEALQQSVKKESDKGVNLGEKTLKSTATVKGDVGDSAANGVVKVRVNHIGQIVSVGEY